MSQHSDIKFRSCWFVIFPKSIFPSCSGVAVVGLPLGDVGLDPVEELLDPDVDAGEAVGGAVEAPGDHSDHEGPPENCLAFFGLLKKKA